MDYKLIKVGNTAGIIIGKKELSKYGLQVGNSISMMITNKQINGIPNEDKSQINGIPISDKVDNGIPINKQDEYGHSKEYYLDKLNSATKRNDNYWIDYYTKKLNN